MAKVFAKGVYIFCDKSANAVFPSKKSKITASKYIKMVQKY